MERHVEQLLLTASDAATALSISPRTLWQLTKDAKLMAVRIGSRVLYDVADIRAFISQHKQTEGNA